MTVPNEDADAELLDEITQLAEELGRTPGRDAIRERLGTGSSRASRLRQLWVTTRSADADDGDTPADHSTDHLDRSETEPEQTGRMAPVRPLHPDHSTGTRPVGGPGVAPAPDRSETTDELPAVTPRPVETTTPDRSDTTTRPVGQNHPTASPDQSDSDRSTRPVETNTQVMGRSTDPTASPDRLDRSETDRSPTATRPVETTAPDRSDGEVPTDHPTGSTDLPTARPVETRPDRSGRSRRPSPGIRGDAVGLLVVALGALVMSVDTSLQLLQDKLQIASMVERIALLSVTEGALIATATSVYVRQRRGEPAGSLRTGMYCLLGVLTVAALIVDPGPGGAVRAALGPLLAAWMFHEALGIERQQLGGARNTITSELVERVRSLFGVADEKRSAEQRRRARALRKYVRKTTPDPLPRSVRRLYERAGLDDPNRQKQAERQRQALEAAAAQYAEAHPPKAKNHRAGR